MREFIHNGEKHHSLISYSETEILIEVNSLIDEFNHEYEFKIPKPDNFEHITKDKLTKELIDSFLKFKLQMIASSINSNIHSLQQDSLAWIKNNIPIIKLTMS